MPGAGCSLKASWLGMRPERCQAYARVTRTGGSNAFITYAIISDGGHPAERSGDAAFVSSSP